MDFTQAILVFGSGTLLVTFFCWVFLNFVALKSTPSIRASWTAGLAYVAASTLYWIGANEHLVFWTPLAAMPASAYAFWSFQKDFRKAWIEKPEDLAEGETLENDDWKYGALRLFLIFVAFALAAIGGRIGQEIMQGLMR